MEDAETGERGFPMMVNQNIMVPPSANSIFQKHAKIKESLAEAA